MRFISISPVENGYLISEESEREDAQVSRRFKRYVASDVEEALGIVRQMMEEGR